MAKRQILVKETNVVKLTQQEIADILQISKVKVNGIMTVLKKDGYIAQISPRGKYFLTDKAGAALKKMPGDMLE